LTALRDEIMYHAHIHPEQYSNTLSDAQLKQLHTSLLHICSTAVDLLAESSQFPEEWLFKHRWGKGKKDQKKELPNGEKIVYITVGGRTSAVVPSVQKKTGPVAGDVKSEDVDDDASPDEDEGDQKPNKKRAPGAKAATKKETPHIEAQTPTGPTKKSRGGKNDNKTNQKDDPVKSPAKKRKAASGSEVNGPAKDEKAKKVKTSTESASAEDEGTALERRRSTRVSGKVV